MLSEWSDDDIIQLRISGHSVRAIAKAQHCSVAQVNEAIDRWAASAIDDKIRKTRTGATRCTTGDVLPGAPARATCKMWCPRDQNH
jgi:transposase